MTDPQLPNPQPIWQIMTGYQHSAAFKTAIELELFTKIADGSHTAAAIAGACDASERGIRILADSLTELGFLTKSGSAYSLTAMAEAFLNKHSRTYLGCAVEFTMAEAQKRGYDDLTNAVKHGGSQVSGDAALDP